MSGNKYRPHICVLPEDDANRQIANGFLTNFNVAIKSINILPIANGWRRVLEDFLQNHAEPMRRNTASYFILLFDFDTNLEQLGATLASECFENRRELWNHELLRHNLRELDRLCCLSRVPARSRESHTCKSSARADHRDPARETDLC